MVVAAEMSRFVVVLLAIVTCGYASNVDNCSWGESYWCSTLENAKACGAFEHCKSTVWKNQILKADDSEVCDFCKNIMQDVTVLVKDNRTQQDIVRFMKNACSVIPSKGLATECSILVDEFLVEILDMIIEDLKPRSICALIKLCTGFDDTVAHSHLPKDPASERLTRVSPLQIRSEPICTDCKKFFTDVKTLLLNNATEAKVEDLIDLAICSQLGTYEATCKDIVKTYMPEIMLLLSAEFDPNVVCQSFGFCTTTLKEAKTFLINLKLKSSEFYKTVSMSSNDAEDGCAICKTVMKDFQDLDRSAAVQRKIEGYLVAGICSHLGSLKNECTTFIEQYGTYLFELLANELDPETRCQSLGFCKASNVIRDPTRESTPSKSSASGQNVADTPECTICKFVVERIDDLIKQNVTKQEIIDALDKICSLMPESLRSQCTSFVTQYGSLIIDLLIQELDPAMVCSTLGLCSAKQRTMPSKLSDATECIVCESAVQYVQALIQENATVAQIEAVLEKICNFLPDKIKSECDFVVQKYGPLIVQYVTTAMTPKAICELVGACQTNLIRPVEMVAVKEEKVVKTSYQLLGAIECSWGPKYWCASKENAKECQATAYCDQIGWEL